MTGEEKTEKTEKTVLELMNLNVDDLAPPRKKQTRKKMKTQDQTSLTQHEFPSGDIVVPKHTHKLSLLHEIEKIIDSDSQNKLADISTAIQVEEKGHPTFYIFKKKTLIEMRSDWYANKKRGERSSTSEDNSNQ